MSSCVCCGEYVPEGRQVCPICEKGTSEMENEQRLIDANALIEKKRQYCSGHGEYDYMVELWHIENAPTVDAVEVVHGRWIIDRENLTATCSECGHILRFSDEMQIFLMRDEERFCYYCGAKMDGDGNVWLDFGE